MRPNKGYKYHAMRFEDLQLIDPLLRAVREEGYTQPTPIQEQAVPHILKGSDLLGCAQTGTGKTAAFALPILQRLSSIPPSGKRLLRVLVLAPTRELATQINDSFRAYGKYTSLKSIVIFGGVNQSSQVEALKRGTDILVATPGRLLDLMQQGYVRLDHIEVLVLDEADRMLDMGFINDMRRVIAAVPKRRQTLLFSATMPPDIQKLADDILNNPIHVAVALESTPIETVQHAIYFVEKNNKRALLRHILRDQTITRALIFTRTKHGANRLVQDLERDRVNADAIHGNKSQSARQRALDNFKQGVTRVLVATDIAARGLDIDEVSHVINFDLPNEPESYVHRIGRTGRAGASGIAFSFCDSDEREYLKDIERTIRMHVPIVEEHPYASELGVPNPTDLSPRPVRRSAPPAKTNGSNRQAQGQNNQGNNRQNHNSLVTSSTSATSNQKRRRRWNRPNPSTL